MSMIANITRRVGYLTGIGLIIATVFGSGIAGADSQPRDANANSVMYNGAYSKGEWLNKVASGDGIHSADDLQQIYYNQGRGITEANFISSATVDGTVFQDGHVEVGGATVAVNALSVGRNYVPGSTVSGSIWQRPTQSVFLSGSIPAFVDMQGGVFHYAIIKSCGNPVSAVPTTKPTPTPIPTPRPTPKPSPSPTTTPTPQQSFECVNIKASQPDSINQPGTFRFTILGSTSNVSVTGYRFTVHQEGATTSPDVSDTAATTNFADFTFGAGTWDVNGQVKTTAGITQISDECSTKVVVTQASPSPVPTPTPTPTGQVLGATLPATGPETLLGGVGGLTAIGYATRGYIRSRKSLLDALRGKNSK
jgi:hypothetical protein